MKAVTKIGFSVFFIALLAVTQASFAQKQGDVWLFGQHCGLNFTKDTPYFFSGGRTGSNIDTIDQEGTSSISDSSGNLLFYTDGENAWNRYNKLMFNGDSLLGNWSSTQSSIIVPLPGCSNFYYLFTTDSYESMVNGFRYNIVDICLDDGKGGIEPGKKNVLLLDTVAEKMCAMMDNDGNYWILVHKLFSDSFCAFHLTSGGITDTVVTRIGAIEGGDNVYTGNIGAARGQMKFSPNGRKVALVMGNQPPGSIIELYNFNQATGKLSNLVTVPVNNPEGYGVEFSADNSKLYVTTGDTMIQFNLTAGGGIDDSVLASKQVISRWADHLMWGMQLAPNGKIYVCQGDTLLGVINKPTLAGTACNFTPDVVTLDHHINRLTLPGFIAGYRYGNGLPDCDMLNVAHSVVDAACDGPLGTAVEKAEGGNGPIAIAWNTSPPQYGAEADNLPVGRYVATVVGSDPCFGAIVVHDTVEIGLTQKVVVAPDAFTPNTETNNFFLPHVNCSDNLNYLFRIYSRWGQKLFETRDPSIGWDGTFNGKREPLDVYVYYIEFTCGNCHDYLKGNITLLR